MGERWGYILPVSFLGTKPRSPDQTKVFCGGPKGTLNPALLLKMVEGSKDECQLRGRPSSDFQSRVGYRSGTPYPRKSIFRLG